MNEQDKPVAWRYEDARGHYRYRGFVPGFDVEYAILKPVPLYTRAAPAPPAAESMSGNIYAERDHMAQGQHYLRHIDRMTAEGLHSKSAIAAELAHRDIEIEALISDLWAYMDAANAEAAPPVAGLPALPDFAPVFKNIMTVDGSKRVQVYNALVDMLQAYARAAIAADRATRVPLTDAELSRTAYKGYDDYWTEDCPGLENEAWAASARAVLAATQGSKP